MRPAEPHDRLTTVAELGRLALTRDDTQALMAEAVRAVRDTLRVDYTGVLELQPKSETVLVRAGTGWRNGCVGSAIVASTLLEEHGVVSAMSSVVAGRTEPFGSIGAFTATAREFTQDDVNFIQAVANALGAAVTLEAVGRVAGGIAHDFNNLLSVIRNYTQFSIEEADQLPKLRADLEEVEKAAARATELTRELVSVRQSLGESA
jgi:signal transduction histidine kinase